MQLCFARRLAGQADAVAERSVGFQVVGLIASAQHVAHASPVEAQ